MSIPSADAAIDCRIRLFVLEFVIAPGIRDLQGSCYWTLPKLGHPLDPQIVRVFLLIRVIVVILLLLSLFAMPDQKFPYFSG
jgi:hypothetical protein